MATLNPPELWFMIGADHYLGTRSCQRQDTSTLKCMLIIACHYQNINATLSSSPTLPVVCRKKPSSRSPKTHALTKINSSGSARRIRTMRATRDTRSTLGSHRLENPWWWGFTLSQWEPWYMFISLLTGIYSTYHYISSLHIWYIFPIVIPHLWYGRGAGVWSVYIVYTEYGICIGYVQIMYGVWIEYMQSMDGIYRELYRMYREYVHIDRVYVE